jgi:hypothetical protein
MYIFLLLAKDGTRKQTQKHMKGSQLVWEVHPVVAL